jgi:hypothetical protein
MGSAALIALLGRFLISSFLAGFRLAIAVLPVLSFGWVIVGLLWFWEFRPRFGLKLPYALLGRGFLSKILFFWFLKLETLGSLLGYYMSDDALMAGCGARMTFDLEGFLGRSE